MASACSIASLGGRNGGIPARIASPKRSTSSWYPIHALEAALDDLVVNLDPHNCLIRSRREGAWNQQAALFADDFGEVVAWREEVAVDQGKLPLAEIQRGGDAALDLASRRDHYLRRG